jgi:hypothetical protein
MIIELRRRAPTHPRTDPRDPRVAPTDYRLIYRSPRDDEPNWGIELRRFREATGPKSLAILRAAAIARQQLDVAWELRQGEPCDANGRLH